MEEKIMKNKKLVLAVVALVAVVALFVGVYFATRPEVSDGGKTITVAVVHKDGTEKSFTYHTEAEYLAEVLVSEGLIEGQTSEFGLMVSTVDGELADWNVDQGYWALYVGEDYAVTGADATPIHDGDSFKWVYTIG